jgi:hypothetical protein
MIMIKKGTHAHFFKLEYVSKYLKTDKRWYLGPSVAPDMCYFLVPPKTSKISFSGDRRLSDLSGWLYAIISTRPITGFER